MLLTCVIFEFKATQLPAPAEGFGLFFSFFVVLVAKKEPFYVVSVFLVNFFVKYRKYPNITKNVKVMKNLNKSQFLANVRA